MLPCNPMEKCICTRYAHSVKPVVIEGQQYLVLNVSAQKEAL